MIEANTKFEDNNLVIDFNGQDIDDRQINISVANDVDFKVLIDLLIEIIPAQTKISTTNESIPEVDNADKLEIIQDTVNEIFDNFNSSVDNLINEQEQEVSDDQDNETQAEDPADDDDLPF